MRGASVLSTWCWCCGWMGFRYSPVRWESPGGDMEQAWCSLEHQELTLVLVLG